MKPWLPYGRPQLSLRAAEILGNRLLVFWASIKISRTPFGAFQIYTRDKKKVIDNI